MLKHTEEQETEPKEAWLREVLSQDVGVDSEPEPKRSLGRSDRTRIISALNAAERTVATQAIRLALALGLNTEHLVRLLWSHVNLESWVVFVPYYPKSNKNKLFVCRTISDLGKSILMELRENRQEDEERVLPGPTEKALLCEVRKTLRGILKDSGLPYINLNDLGHGGEIRIEMEGGDSRLKFTGDMKFCDLPFSLGEEVLRGVWLRSRDWPMESAYQRGIDAAVQWLAGATLSEISDVAYDSGRVTYLWNPDENDDEDLELTGLTESAVACVVKELLGLNEWPLATKENINFEAGVHHIVYYVQLILAEIIRLEGEDKMRNLPVVGN